ncbi:MULTISPECIES: Hpt domain-containing protein [Marinovum]|jgi:HPt (histidine-containing phosphotransfer) domain-containing protein|uniref:Hpt domain-containing protein n=1 Tax=Marinovum TaxID=367771 RepID=UPI00237B3DB8|nr:Hpt domain-containing protein [Marinovum sp. PR37]MDD9743131.1 Hpt domain-containing protein [Marinovum sp. PR37]
MIDWSRVSELREEVGEEDFAEVVELFLDEVDGVIGTLAPETADLEAQLHFLKGSALNLGFAAFAALCQAGETAANAGQGERVDVAAIRDAYARARSEFTSGLTTRRAG